MMKNWFTLVMSVIVVATSYGQKQEVLDKLAEYGIDEDFLHTSLQDHDAVYAFDFKTITNDGTKNIVWEGHFDPLQPVGQRWVLKTVNGQPPTKKELKKFSKMHNTKQPEINGRVADDSWRVAADTEEEIVISFKYDRESLPKKYAFLADCTGKAYISKKSGKLHRASFENDGPLKVKIFNVSDLDMEVEYVHIPEDNVYLIAQEDLDMKVKLLGQIVEIEEVNEYSNHRKVK